MLEQFKKLLKIRMGIKEYFTNLLKKEIEKDSKPGLKNAVTVGDQEVTLQELESQTDHRTLGEIEEDEQDQWVYIQKDLKDYRFNTMEGAGVFVGECVVQVLRKCGVVNELGAKKMDGRLIFMNMVNNDKFAKAMYQKHKVRFSRHRDSQGDEFWEAGAYIYKDKECVAFISDGSFVKSEYIVGPAFYVVRTNVQLPGGKGVKAA